MSKTGIEMQMDLKPLKKLQRKSPEIFNKAMKKGAIQFLKWANEGSERETRKPPIRWGVLRGSASAFVGSQLVAMSAAEQTGSQAGASTKNAPLTQYKEVPTTISWIWNTTYAAAMHEHTGNWGEATSADSDAGNKWLEKHLIADKEALMDMIEKEFWREAEKFEGSGL